MRFLVVLTAFLLTACQADSRTRAYSNAEIGLSLIYPASWKVVDDPKLLSELHAPEGELVFFIAKPDKIAKRSPNLLIAVVPVSDKLCSEANSASFVSAAAVHYSESSPGAVLMPQAHITPASEIPGFTISVPLTDHTVLQRRYQYCTSGRFVVITATSSTSEADVELRSIIATIRLVASNNSFKPKPLRGSA